MGERVTIVKSALPKSLIDENIKDDELCGMKEKSHLIVFDDLNVSK